MEILFLLSAMLAVTYIPRALPALFIDKMHLSKRAEKFLSLIPYTAMAALIFPGVLSVDANAWYIGFVGALVAVVLSLTKWGKMPIVVIAAVLTLVGIYTFV